LRYIIIINIDNSRKVCYNERKEDKVKWKVVFGPEELRKHFGEIEVEAVDRWGAVVEAAKMCGLDSVVKMQTIFQGSSVKKVYRKGTREWRAEGSSEDEKVVENRE